MYSDAPRDRPPARPHLVPCSSSMIAEPGERAEMARLQRKNVRWMSAMDGP
jgi:hypothetical protein